ncbi:MAG: FIG01022095: hypothetical protein [uncultured Thermomicrobiales bacterium]|uniref:Glucose/Sorbosone dehydrogenase domain-containing protein n=1 Tax=uncultured Thermomicrobiales bacterium TaxID=1645740 RepID=A0A6J4UBZ8_9BACT|nr:MAG: FIG01022095: hypothetical protein [uncultured Thermomicrobiales bacterium]
MMPTTATARLRRGALLLLALMSAPVFATAATAQDEPTPVFDPAAFAVDFELVADGFERPLYVAHAGDGSGRLFVVEQPGRIRIVQDGQTLPDPFLDIVDLVESGGNEQGLLSVAFHPDYETNGLFYVGYTARNSDAGVGDNTIARYSVSGDPNRADPDSAQILLAVEDPYPNHNGGLVLFGPDGHLYAGMGDGGSRGDPEGNGQNPQALLGKILRLDVNPDLVTAQEPYLIPADNPFADGAAAAPEIWATGLRNPWRFSFDRATGDLYIADVGQNAIEEVNHQAAASIGGENYGWNLLEGRDCYADPDCDPAATGTVLPVSGYSHDFGCSITGGYVYRGAAAPALTGVYLFADFCTGLAWGLGRDAGGDWATSEPVETGLAPNSFGEDEAGEVYLTDINGGIYRVTGG